MNRRKFFSLLPKLSAMAVAAPVAYPCFVRWWRIIKYHRLRNLGLVSLRDADRALASVQQWRKRITGKAPNYDFSSMGIKPSRADEYRYANVVEYIDYVNGDSPVPRIYPPNAPAFSVKETAHEDHPK